MTVIYDDNYNRAIICDLATKIRYLISFLDINGLLSDHSFTFPDGEIWPTLDYNNVEDQPKADIIE